MRALLLAVVLFVVAGCSDPNASVNTALNLNKQTGRIQVISAQIFYDAGGNSRDILVLHDKETGTEYLVVMGAGVQTMKSKAERAMEVVGDALGD